MYAVITEVKLLRTIIVVYFDGRVCLLIYFHTVCVFVMLICEEHVIDENIPLLRKRKIIVNVFTVDK